MASPSTLSGVFGLGPAGLAIGLAVVLGFCALIAAAVVVVVAFARGMRLSDGPGSPGNLPFKGSYLDQ